MDEVLKGEKLRFFELCSPNEEAEDVLKAAKDWNVEHLLSGYDNIYGVFLAEEAGNIIQAFEKLKARNLRVKYMMLLGGEFTDEKEFCEIYRQYFRARGCFFYQQESAYYFSSDFKPEEIKKSGFEKNAEEVIHSLVYNASVNEIEKLVSDICEEGLAPEILIDYMIELLISLKSQLTRTYQDRAFMVLRHQNLWDLHQVRTKEGLKRRMKELLEAAAEAVGDILDHRTNYTLNGKIMDYIWENFSRTDFSAGEAAEKVHLSRNYFLKLFKDENKLSF